MKSTKFLSAIFVMAVILSSCKGDTGPAGSPGASGAANISNADYTVTSWSGTGPIYSATFSAPDITSQTSDLVVGYFINNTGQYLPLPCSNLYVAGDELVFSFNTGTLTFAYYDPSGSPGGTWLFRVVVVPPAAQKRHPNTNWHNYAEVNSMVLSQQAGHNQ